MNLAFQQTIIRKSPLEIIVVYIDLDETGIREYPIQKTIIIEDITLNLKQATTYIFNQLDLFFNTDVIQIEISLGDGSIKFLFDEGEKIYNSKLFVLESTNKNIAIGLRTIGKILINQIRKAKGLVELDLSDLLKAEIGVMPAEAIKDMSSRQGNTLTDAEVTQMRTDAQKNIDDLIKNKSHLYKKSKEK